MKTNRDVTIDIFKGFTILWVIHIHTVFWTGTYLPTYIRELSLFIDVPIFFFLSGYLMFIGSFKNTLSRSLRQLMRMYSTYLFLSISAYFLVVLIKLWLGFPLPDIAQHLFSLSHLYANFPELKSLGWNLWFLRCYFPIILFMPLFSFCNKNALSNLGLTILSFSSYLVLREYGGIGIFGFQITYISFYATYFFLGSTFRMIESKIKLKMLSVIYLAILVIVGLSIYKDNFYVIMQGNKFPPTVKYFLYSLPYVFLFMLIKCFFPHKLNKIPSSIKKLLTWSSHEVYRIYLIHSFVCWLPIFFVPHMKAHVPSFFLYLIVLFFNSSVSIILVWLFRRLTLFIGSFMRPFALPLKNKWSYRSIAFRIK